MKELVLDFETSDHYVRDRNLGEGWVYKIHNKEQSDYKVLTAGMRLHSGEYIVTSDWRELAVVIKDHDTIVCHNATYDIGALLSLGIGAKDKLIIDTVLLSKMFRNNLFSHSLDALAQRYLGHKKGQDILADIVWDNNLYPWLKKELKEKEKAVNSYIRPRPDNKKLSNFAYGNMELVFNTDPDKVNQYCLLDVKLTWELYQYFIKQKRYDDLEDWSDLIKATLRLRLNGIRVDLKRAREVHNHMLPIIAQLYQKVYDIAGEEFNLASNKDMTRVLGKLGIRCPKTLAGRDSATSGWLATLDHPVGKAISKAKEALKLDKDFIQPIIDMQKWTMGVEDPSGLDYGRIFPHLRIFGANATSRFSATTPNIQQIPARNEEYGALCRSIFVPEEGETFADLDWMNQEGRIQVHFSYKYNCNGADRMVSAYQKNPQLDMHQYVADMCGGIDRKLAKVINLGLPYGMGKAKLVEHLGQGGEAVLDTYFRKAPFLKELMGKLADEIKFKGFITTIDGVRLWKDPPIWKDGKEKDFSYKAINYISQGSAAGQARKALIAAYRANLPVIVVIHDEFCLSIKDISQAEKMKEIMETVCDFSVPFVAEIQLGANWAETKFKKEVKNAGV